MLLSHIRRLIYTAAKLCRNTVILSSRKSTSNLKLDSKIDSVKNETEVTCITKYYRTSRPTFHSELVNGKSRCC